MCPSNLGGAWLKVGERKTSFTERSLNWYQRVPMPHVVRAITPAMDYIVNRRLHSANFPQTALDMIKMGVRAIDLT